MVLAERFKARERCTALRRNGEKIIESQTIELSLSMVFSFFDRMIADANGMATA